MNSEKGKIEGKKNKKKYQPMHVCLMFDNSTTNTSVARIKKTKKTKKTKEPKNQVESRTLIRNQRTFVTLQLHKIWQMR